jgi:hypothetical protein
MSNAFDLSLLSDPNGGVESATANIDWAADSGASYITPNPAPDSLADKLKTALVGAPVTLDQTMAMLNSAGDANSVTYDTVTSTLQSTSAQADGSNGPQQASTQIIAEVLKALNPQCDLANAATNSISNANSILTDAVTSAQLLGGTLSTNPNSTLNTSNTPSAASTAAAGTLVTTATDPTFTSLPIQASNDTPTVSSTVDTTASAVSSSSSSSIDSQIQVDTSNIQSYLNKSVATATDSLKAMVTALGQVGGTNYTVSNVNIAKHDHSITHVEGSQVSNAYHYEVNSSNHSVQASNYNLISDSIYRTSSQFFEQHDAKVTTVAGDSNSFHGGAHNTNAKTHNVVAVETSTHTSGDHTVQVNNNLTHNVGGDILHTAASISQMSTGNYSIVNGSSYSVNTIVGLNILGSGDSTSLKASNSTATNTLSTAANAASTFTGNISHNLFSLLGINSTWLNSLGAVSNVLGGGTIHLTDNFNPFSILQGIISVGSLIPTDLIGLLSLANPNILRQIPLLRTLTSDILKGCNKAPASKNSTSKQPTLGTFTGSSVTLPNFQSTDQTKTTVNNSTAKSTSSKKPTPGGSPAIDLTSANKNVAINPVGCYNSNPTNIYCEWTLPSSGDSSPANSNSNTGVVDAVPTLNLSIPDYISALTGINNPTAIAFLSKDANTANKINNYISALNNYLNTAITDYNLPTNIRTELEKPYNLGTAGTVELISILSLLYQNQPLTATDITEINLTQQGISPSDANIIINLFNGSMAANLLQAANYAISNVNTTIQQAVSPSTTGINAGGGLFGSSNSNSQINIGGYNYSVSNFNLYSQANPTLNLTSPQNLVTSILGDINSLNQTSPVLNALNINPTNYTDQISAITNSDLTSNTIQLTLNSAAASTPQNNTLGLSPQSILVFNTVKNSISQTLSQTYPSSTTNKIVSALGNITLGSAQQDLNSINKLLTSSGIIPSQASSIASKVLPIATTLASGNVMSLLSSQGLTQITNALSSIPGISSLLTKSNTILGDVSNLLNIPSTVANLINSKIPLLQQLDTLINCPDLFGSIGKALGKDTGFTAISSAVNKLNTQTTQTNSTAVSTSSGDNTTIAASNDSTSTASTMSAEVAAQAYSQQAVNAAASLDQHPAVNSTGQSLQAARYMEQLPRFIQIMNSIALSPVTAARELNNYYQQVGITPNDTAENIVSNIINATQQIPSSSTVVQIPQWPAEMATVDVIGMNTGVLSFGMQTMFRPDTYYPGSGMSLVVNAPQYLYKGMTLTIQQDDTNYMPITLNYTVIDYDPTTNLGVAMLTTRYTILKLVDSNGLIYELNASCIGNTVIPYITDAYIFA